MYTPPPLGKIIPFPIIVATLLAALIAVFAPELGFFAWGSAWIGTFVVLTVWGVLHYHMKDGDDDDQP